MRGAFGNPGDARVRENRTVVWPATARRPPATWWRTVDGLVLRAADTPSSPTYGNPPGLNGFLELQPLAAAGVPLPRLLEGATIEAARAFHLDSLYGTVEAGKVANLLLLRANPLETVEAYDAIDLVVVRGKAVDRPVLAAR